jgi:hypothetical protein
MILTVLGSIGLGLLIFSIVLFICGFIAHFIEQIAIVGMIILWLCMSTLIGFMLGHHFNFW